ncbi:hypothetical protein BDZ91DRAFT_709291 [Kalaharituber pfeilii]|nr:hypothetical protein BDZ91DRAFT_709291 [Kalaharituber pfeilii]
MASLLFRTTGIGLGRQLVMRQFPRATLPVLQLARHQRGASGQAFELPQHRLSPSMRLDPKEKADMLLRDIGLLPYTFVPLSRKNRPSIFKQPIVRLQLMRKRIGYKIRNLISIGLYKWFGKGKIEYFAPRSHAVDLYKSMYESYSLGDTTTLRQICSDGLYEDFKNKIMRRGRARLVWKMHSVVGYPRIVSNTAVTFADLGISFRQAVVKIRSLQSIHQFDSRGKPVPGTGNTQPVVEYVVLQKRKTKEEEGPWIIWGTTEETPLDLLIYREKTHPLNMAAKN